MTDEARILQGMRDWLPRRNRLRSWVTGELRTTFELFGFEPLDTPALEYGSTLKGKYGEEADKLIYQFIDRGGREVGLRYDLTVPLARVVASYPELPRPFKRYQIAPVWRAERPQRGRYREFTQCDVDIVGATSRLADAEIIAVISAGLERLGFPDYTIRLNNRKILQGVAAELGAEGDRATELFRALDKLDKIGPEGVTAELVERGWNSDTIQRTLEATAVQGTTSDALADLRRRYALNERAIEGIAETEAIVAGLAALGVDDARLRVDLTMIRGLDYYTGPIYEVVVEQPRIGSVSGGGRYDGLIGIFSKQAIPATGGSFGLERIIDVIEDQKLEPAALARTVSEVLVTVFNAETQAASLALARDLRANDIRTEISLIDERLSNQLRSASRRGIPTTIILGPDEVAAGSVVVRDMTTGNQSTIARADVAAIAAAIRSGTT